MKLLRSELATFDTDRTHAPAVSLVLDFSGSEYEVPPHIHRKGQMVLAHRGAVTCVAANGLWVVPPQCAVWIPGGVEHSNRATPNAQLSYLFVEPGIVPLPGYCCTLAISPVVKELVHRLAEETDDYAPGSHAEKLAFVLLTELTFMPQQQLNLPISNHPKIRKLTESLTQRPDDRSTLNEWATRLAVSERSLSRLVETETGLTFGRWRQQLQLIIALRELASGTTVQRVSEHLGYESVDAFIKMFKKAVGTSPGKYFSTQRS